jgi:hypothetical protein
MPVTSSSAGAERWPRRGCRQHGGHFVTTVPESKAARRPNRETGSAFAAGIDDGCSAATRNGSRRVRAPVNGGDVLGVSLRSPGPVPRPGVDQVWPRSTASCTNACRSRNAFSLPAKSPRRRGECAPGGVRKSKFRRLARALKLVAPFSRPGALRGDGAGEEAVRPSASSEKTIATRTRSSNLSLRRCADANRAREVACRDVGTQFAHPQRPASTRARRCRAGA